jgi:phosphatidate cytidylyltransferase
MLVLGSVWWLIALFMVITYPASVALWKNAVVRLLVGFLVLVPSAIALIFITRLKHGNWIFLYTVAIVVMADVGAYVFGRWLGNRKLAVLVSPGKSWAGFWGGFCCALLMAAIIGQFYNIAGLGPVALVVCTGIAALVSVLGDLFESMFKRERGIKDSSQLLPGHGGILDRIDSITAAAPVFTLLFLLLQQAVK